MNHSQVVPRSQAVCPFSVSGQPTLAEDAVRKSTPRWFEARHAQVPEQWRGVATPSESAADIFRNYVSDQVVQAKCVNCHVEGGVSGHTRLVLSASSVDGHEALNLAAFENFLSSVERGSDLILNKIQGVAHGGGMQVLAGSVDFANMERFLRLLGGETSSSALTPETLFDGVTMASPGKTLRRAALLFAGRLPRPGETNAVLGGSTDTLRRVIRGVMQGPGFHDFIIRSANDRLLTDRRLGQGGAVIDEADGFFVNITNRNWELKEEALAHGAPDPFEYPPWTKWYYFYGYGAGRAPLELIAHVAENDLPYTEILTADYIMANRDVAEGYGADTEFQDPVNPFQFKPARIVDYYRTDDSKVIEDRINFATRVVNPGNLSTQYPHAGILNTTVFLRRYPTTDTNRNRARARWTYYHFLGVDIEKSASRTTDPEALADRDNPTMKNPACTVCHTIMDPVAGTFQNYGVEGLYREEWGGLDSLPGLYKYPEDGSESPYVHGDTWFRDMREPGFDGMVAPDPANSLQWLAARIVADDRFAEAAVEFWWPAIMGAEVATAPEDERDRGFAGKLLAANAQALEVKRLAEAFREGIAGGRAYNLKDLLVEIALSPWFRAETVADTDPVRNVALSDAGAERLLTPEELSIKTEAITGYAWGRRLDWDRGAGRHDLLGHSWGNYRMLYGGIDSDAITRRATEMTPLMAAVAQTHAVEVSCPIVLREFYYWPQEARLLFDGIDRSVTPEWESTSLFRVSSTSLHSPNTPAVEITLPAGTVRANLRFANWTDYPVQERILHLNSLVVRDAEGAVVDEVELSSLPEIDCGSPVDEEYHLAWTCPFDVPVTAPATGTYAIEVSGYQRAAGDENARLRIGRDSLEVASDSSDSPQTVTARVPLIRGLQTVRLELENEFYLAESILLDRMVVRNQGGSVVSDIEFESLDVNCGWPSEEDGAVHLDWDGCSLSAPIEIPTTGSYRIEVQVSRSLGSGPLGELEMSVESDAPNSRGSEAIRRKLVDLHKKLFGVTLRQDSPDIESAYRLFVEVWDDIRTSQGGVFWDSGERCDIEDLLYFRRNFRNIWEHDEWGNAEMNWERIEQLTEGIDFGDPSHVVRTWKVVLAALLTDYRYLHF